MLFNKASSLFLYHLKLPPSDLRLGSTRFSLQRKHCLCGIVRIWDHNTVAVSHLLSNPNIMTYVSSEIRFNDLGPANGCVRARNTASLRLNITKRCLIGRFLRSASYQPYRNKAKDLEAPAIYDIIISVNFLVGRPAGLQSGGNWGN